MLSKLPSNLRLSLLSEIGEFHQNLVSKSYNINISFVNSETYAFTMLCSKETAKDTGLNVWVDPDNKGNQAGVE